MSTTNVCPRCGAELSHDAPQDLCPECLLKVGMESNTDVGRRGAAVESAGALDDDLGDSPTVHYAGGSNSRGSSAQQIELPEPGQRFGHYRLVRKLGQGGMGAVFEADDLESGRRVALKLLTHAVESAEARNRFFREGRLAASINHPNSVYVYGTEEIEGTPAISMEQVTGGTLHDRVRQDGPLSVTAAVDVILQIIDGLAAAAEVGVLHRDVKPANCFVDIDGTAKVGDFGLSISTTARGDTHLTQPDAFLGTPAFSSPEQLRGDDLDVRSDIYAVGVTLFYLLTGRTPYQADNLVKLLATVLEQQPPSPAKFRPELPQGLAKVVLRCLAKQPSDRFKNYGELRDALVPYNSTAPTPATLGLRLLAGLCDHILWSVAAATVNFVVFGASFDSRASAARYFAWTLTFVLAQVLYFAIPEGLWGASPGKALFRLRVLQPDRRLIGIPRAALRAAIWFILPQTVILSYWFVQGPQYVPDFQGTGMIGVMLVSASYFPLLALLFSTARRRNGYAGLHDLAVGARVVQRPGYGVRPALGIEVEPLPDKTAEVTIGPYQVLDSLDKTDTEELLLGYDTRLLRRVWIHKLPTGCPPISAERRNLSRVGRLRWINGSRDTGDCWDAYEALSGKPLVELIDSPQPWRVVRYWLLDLANELRDGSSDGSLPAVLQLDRVWITAEGRAKLLDFPAPTKNKTRHVPPASSPQQFLLHVATSALGVRSDCVEAANDEARIESIAARVPVDGYSLLRHLPTAELAGVADGLKRLIKRTPNVSRLRRSGMLAATAAIAVVTTLSSVGAFYVMAQWERQQPEIKQLQTCLRKLNRQQSDEPEREALKTYIAGHFRETINRPPSWNTVYARTIPQSMREQAEEIVERRPPPSVAELEDAAVVVAPMLDESDDKMVFTAGFSLFMALFQFASTWMVFVMIPTILAAILVRRGMISRAFGVDYVTLKGKLASRSRMLWRSVVFNTPMLLGLFGMVALQERGTMHIEKTLPLLAVLLIVLGVTVCSGLLPQRGLTDRLSGTYPVPR